MKTEGKQILKRIGGISCIVFGFIIISMILYSTYANKYWTRTTELDTLYLMCDVSYEDNSLNLTIIDGVVKWEDYSVKVNNSEVFTLVERSTKGETATFTNDKWEVNEGETFMVEVRSEKNGRVVWYDDVFS